MLKKILLTFVAVFIAVSTIFPRVSNAAPWYAPTLDEFNQKVQTGSQTEIFGERYTQAQVYWIVYSLVNILIGDGVLACTQTDDIAQISTCLDNSLNSTPLPGVGGLRQDMGLIIPLASLIDSTIKFRPASGVGYVAEKMKGLNVVNEAYAQNTGFGYETLNPVSKLWTPVRNASFALMTLVIVILAFMIMFRQKISPQASLTVQIAIPRIIIALVLITFSFAIAGFLIDLAYVVLGLIGSMFSVAGVSTLTPIEMFGGLQHWGNGMVSIGVMLILHLIVPTVLGGAAFGFGFIAGVLLMILVLIIYLLALVKILWTMFRAMLTLTLLVVFSPIFILWGVISTSGGFGNWLKSFVGSLSIFVTIPLLIFFANVIMWGSVGGPSVLAPSLFLNPYGIDTTLIAGGMELPGFFGGYNSIFGLIGGLILLLSAAKLAGSIKDYITTGRAQFGLEDAKGALGPVYGAYALGSSAVTGSLSKALGESILPPATVSGVVGRVFARRTRGLAQSRSPQNNP